MLALRGPAGRGSPAATHFLCFAKESKQRKATRLSWSLRFATGNLRCAPKAGVRPNSPSAQTSAALIPLLGHSIGPARTGLSGSETREKNQNPNPIQTRTRLGVSLWTSGFGIWYLVFGIWYLVFGIWMLAVRLSGCPLPPLVSAPRSTASGGSGPRAV